MEKKIFDEMFVHFLWDDKLKDKKGFVSDNIGRLRHYVETHDVSMFCSVEEAQKGVEAYPFSRIDDEAPFRFFYYDPLYDVKLAWKQGKRIQFGGPSGIWLDTSNPDWDNKSLEFRVKPEARRMTYRELAEWADKQNGEIKSPTDPSYVFCDFGYREGLENEELSEGYQLRRWGSDAWIKPTVEVYEQDCKKE